MRPRYHLHGIGARRYVFVEYGPMELDLNLRVRVHELEQHLQQKVWGSWQPCLVMVCTACKCLG